ncbi:phosphate/phosphite/phosphonate ABC transporter substrate-binding protein [Aliiglaciecola sp. LCG003]|uniref:phosphate/phosphite/phosphonate ABC transporter substrate-binding protein n=1 Tax=Aliiglaciecola sp. LCG003 TaxID=3053655 RepID=UPI002572BA2E|nr:phosphate/phosphite/phosphonate ABC transporter substrate-binding protein [Aliiglaciecola sp. LCG003]WJG07800.1 phosphate/phosphite/phosphonate ABC transporter substrate-binding protein [Aliiglaciecola sp. LCG003]
MIFIFLNQPLKNFQKCLLNTGLLLIASLLLGCEPESTPIYKPTFSDISVSADTQYVFGVHPLHNPQLLFEVFSPLMEYLSKNIDGVNFKLEASRNYESYNEKLYTHKFDFSLPNPYQTINAIDRGYNVFAKMGDDENFKGIILVRRDSDIKNITDLKGKSISYPAPSALAATMLPQYFLQKNGVNVLTELDNRYVGSQESSIMSVFLGQTSAAATWPPPWKALIKERPELADQLFIKWQTEPLLNNALVVLPSVPEELVQKVRFLLINLHKTEEGKNVLARMELSRFEGADNDTYQSIRDFIKIFNKEVRTQ